MESSVVGNPLYEQFVKIIEFLRLHPSNIMNEFPLAIDDPEYNSCRFGSPIHSAWHNSSKRQQ